MKLMKMDWLGMERELREVLRMCNGDIHERFALLCIDEILARYTLRGNSIESSGEEYNDTAKIPELTKYFDWSE